MRLKHRHDPGPRIPPPSGVDRGPDFRGMVGVVVHDRDPGGCAQELKAPLDTWEAGKARPDVFPRDAEPTCGGRGAQCVQRVVSAGQRNGQLTQVLAGFEDAQPGTGPVRADIDAPELRSRAEAVGVPSGTETREQPRRPRIVRTGAHPPLGRY